MTTVVVDPRLRARRIEVLRAEGRKRLRWVVVVCTLVGAAVVTLVALRSPLFDVDHLSISGAERTSTSAITAAAGLDLDEPLVEVDLDAIAARVEELPWIDEANVRRDWPGSIVVEVVERRPAAAVAIGDSVVLADVAGRVLATTSRVPADLAVVELAARSGEVLPGGQLDPDEQPALVLAARAPEALRLDPGVVRHDDGDLLWEVEGVGRFRFGTLADLDAKLVAAAAVLEQLDGVVDGELDLREPSAVVRRVDRAAITAPGGTDDTATGAADEVDS